MWRRELVPTSALGLAPHGLLQGCVETRCNLDNRLWISIYAVVKPKVDFYVNQAFTWHLGCF